MDAQSISAKVAAPDGVCLAGMWPESGEGRVVSGEKKTERPIPTTDNRRLTTDKTGRNAHPTVAVVIISHNYGRFLREAIQSVLSQTVRPAEIVVVDDASTDNTRAVALTYDHWRVKYERIDAKNVNAGRQRGFEVTTADVICFLDADDKLSPDYLELGLQAFGADPRIALVYSDWEYFGTRKGRETFPAAELTDINWRNFAHSASLVKRSALITVDAFKGLPDQTACRHHCDWALWRRVLTGTRRAAKQAGLLHYRQHDSNWLQTAMRDRGTYYDRAALALEPVTIFVPFSGRRRAMLDLLCWLERQTFPRDQCRLVLMDCSQDENFNRRLSGWAIGGGYRDVRILQRTVGEKDLAGADATAPESRRKIVQAMWQIYDGLAGLETEYIMTVEDDVIPPDDAIDTLLRGMDHDVFSVASPYRSRYEGWMAWDVTGPLLKTPKTGLQPTLGNGFGCTLLRRSVLRRWAIGPYGKWPDYDMAHYQYLRDHTQWRALVDWDCRSTHAGLRPWPEVAGCQLPVVSVEKQTTDNRPPSTRGARVWAAVRDVGRRLLAWLV